jgi:uncharacterized protein DUF5403
MAEIYLNDKQMNKLISHLPGVRSVIRKTAYEGAARAEAILAAHRVTGASRITVTHGNVDSFVNLDDTRGYPAAAAIEYGRKRRGVTSGVHALRSAF